MWLRLYNLWDTISVKFSRNAEWSFRNCRKVTQETIWAIGEKKGPKKDNKAQKSRYHWWKKGFWNENFGRRVTRNMPCWIDRNCTVHSNYLIYYICPTLRQQNHTPIPDLCFLIHLFQSLYFLQQCSLMGFSEHVIIKSLSRRTVSLPKLLDSAT